MPRKSVKLSAPVADPPKPIVDPPKPVVPASPPKTEVHTEGKWSDDGDTTNDLVVQRISLPRVDKRSNKVTFRQGFRVFIRPDDLHDEPNETWDEHEPEDEAAIRRLFVTHGKGKGTRISILSDVDGSGNEVFSLEVRSAKPNEGDEKYPSVFVSKSSNVVAEIVADLFYVTSDEDPPDDFTTRGALDDLVEELKGDVEELEPVRSVLDEFGMPGDLPSHLYSLTERLRSIFRTVKGLGK